MATTAGFGHMPCYALSCAAAFMRLVRRGVFRFTAVLWTAMSKMFCIMDPCDVCAGYLMLWVTQLGLRCVPSVVFYRDVFCD